MSSNINYNKSKEALLIKFQDNSIFEVYHFIRFSAFPDVSEADKKDLFMKLIFVPLRNEDILSELVDSITSNNFTALTLLADNNMIDVNLLKNRAISNGMRFDILKDFEAVWEGYFTEEDSSLALNLLKTLLLWDPVGNGNENMNNFIRKYQSTTDTNERHMLVDRIFWESYSV